jgi:cellulose biosynthesis protein BcsQ
MREYILTNILESITHDIILVEYAPSVDLFHFASLVAAEYLLIPTSLDKLAVNGVRDALQTLAMINRSGNTNLVSLSYFLSQFIRWRERKSRSSHLKWIQCDDTSQFVDLLRLVRNINPSPGRHHKPLNTETMVWQGNPEH